MLSITSHSDTTTSPVPKAAEAASTRAPAASPMPRRRGERSNLSQCVNETAPRAAACLIRERSVIQGFTMLEVLIAIVVIAFGLLGIAGLQAFAMQNNYSASLRITATTLANDMIDRMKANYMAVDQGHYDKPNASDYTTAVPSCLTTAGCTFDQLAQNDLNEWSQRVAAALPNGRGIVCVDSTPNDGTSQAAPACDGLGTVLFVVKIWWIDDRTSTGSAAAPQRFSWTFNP